MSQQRFCVEFSAGGQVGTAIYRADDARCAVGILLDAHDDGEVTYDWIKVQPAVVKMPDGVKRAYDAAVARRKRV